MKSEISMRDQNVMQWTSQIVGAYVSGNEVAVQDLPDLMDLVYHKVRALSGCQGSEAGQRPAVPIEASITPDHIICLEDGKKFKMLKKHLNTQYGLSPEEYRAKWGLPVDYPMVAPNYAMKRQQLAKASGLGKSRPPV